MIVDYQTELKNFILLTGMTKMTENAKMTFHWSWICIELKICRLRPSSAKSLIKMTFFYVILLFLFFWKWQNGQNGLNWDKPVGWWKSVSKGYFFRRSLIRSHYFYFFLSLWGKWPTRPNWHWKCIVPR